MVGREKIISSLLFGWKINQPQKQGLFENIVYVSVARDNEVEDDNENDNTDDHIQSFLSKTYVGVDMPEVSPMLMFQASVDFQS